MTTRGVVSEPSGDAGMHATFAGTAAGQGAARREGKSLIPRGFILLVAGAMLASIALVVTLRFQGIAPLGASSTLNRMVRSEITLTFADREDGQIAVFAEGEAQPAAVWHPAADSFQQGVLRVVRRQRMLAAIEGPVAVRLVAWDSGGLTVIDDATQTEIELGAFGPDNAARFAELLTVAKAGPLSNRIAEYPPGS